MNVKKNMLDQEELDIEKAIEQGEYKVVKNSSEVIAKYQKIAKAHGNKVQRVNLRMTKWDYEKAQEKALREGLPYQTFLSSILHKYLDGQLVERKVY